MGGTEYLGRSAQNKCLRSGRREMWCVLQKDYYGTGDVDGPRRREGSKKKKP